MNDRQPNFAEPEMDDQDEGRVVEGTAVLTQLNAAEINQQIMTARAYPRSIVGFRRNMREMVTYDQATALSCLYALKRSGKVIQGPSIRFAEAAVQAWGNVRVGARVTDVGEEFITGQGFFYDLEKNTAIAVEVMRRITTSEGHRYGDDMIGVTGNAACSIALRNAILRGIPKTAWLEPYEAAQHLSIGKGESITVKRDGMIKAFAPLGVDKDQIFGLLGVKGLDDISIDQLIFMGGVLNSLKEGEAKVEEVFALENMQNPDQARPPAPKHSEFKKDDKKPAGKKAEAAKPKDKEKPAPAAAKAAEPKADAKPKDQQQPQDSEAARKAALESERQDFIKDAYAELDLQTKIIDTKTGGGVSPLRERVIEGGVLNAGEQKAWEAACDAKNKAIMASARAK